MQNVEHDTPIFALRRRQRFAAPIRKTYAIATEEKLKLRLVLLFFIAHVPLAILTNINSGVARLHLLVTLTIALWAALSSKIERAAYACAYITGAEVLWRMSGASIFWEIGKYGVAVVLIVAMIRHKRFRPPKLVILYFALLIPSTFLTIGGLSFFRSRQMLSGDLSGPFALMIAGCFFSQLSLTREKLIRLFLTLIGPVVAVAALVFFDVAIMDDINFGSSSNFETSGGFGPNQVSSVLGMGALACFLVMISEKAETKLKVVAGVLMIYLAAQSALTFSRGGFYNVLGGVLLASIFLLKDPKTRAKFVLAMIVISSISLFIVLPRLDSFTKGALSARFKDTGTTGRDEIVQMDLEIWYDNPIMGVGPGRASHNRAQMGFNASAHTEFTRLLAEHGIFGLMAIFVLIAMAVKNLINAGSSRERAVVIALTAWAFLFMLGAGMRLVAPAIMFGLGYVTIIDPQKISAGWKKIQPLPLPGRPGKKRL